MGATWHTSFVARMVIMLPVLSLVMLNRLEKADNINFAQDCFLYLIANLLIETSVWTNIKFRASLCLKVKSTKQQQRQLSDILDSVPDSVFICAKNSKSDAE